MDMGYDFMLPLSSVALGALAVLVLTGVSAAVSAQDVVGRPDGEQGEPGEPGPAGLAAGWAARPAG